VYLVGYCDDIGTNSCTVYAADIIQVFFYMFRVAKWKGRIDIDRRKYFGRTEMGEIDSGTTPTIESLN